MMVAVEGKPYESPDGGLYDPSVVKRELMGVEEVRKALGKRLDAANDKGVHTVIAKHGEPVGALVPMKWYRRMCELAGEPTEY